MKIIKWNYSNENVPWAEKACPSKPCAEADAGLELDGNRYQKMFGFGGCLNERGYRALRALPESFRAKLLRELFEPERDGCSLNFCRIPVGANDYSENWYSLDETPGDYSLRDFSIERDKKELIPYIRCAMEYAPDLKLFASPWSPPTWMKTPPVYNGGKLTEGVCYPVQAEVGSSGGYSWVRIFVAGVQRYAAVLADRCRLVTLSPGDAFAACVAQGGDAAGQRAQRDGRQAGAYAQRTEASGTAPGV